MKQKVLPLGVKQTLEEDDDQGEMDVVFFICVTSYSLFVIFRKSLFTGQDYEDVGKFVLIMTNMFAFFPIMQAQGLWLKLLLIITCFSSIMWHWTEVGLNLPGNHSTYGDVDAAFSIMSIVSYCIQWVPIPPPPEIEAKDFFTRNFLGRPKQTAEWRCRLTPALLINMIITISSGVCTILYREYTIFIAIGFVFVAFILAMFHLLAGKMTIGSTYRKKFAAFALCGIVFGSTSFVFFSEDSWYSHSLWHTYVFSCAYSFSRASEYLEFKNNSI